MQGRPPVAPAQRWMTDTVFALAFERAEAPLT